ncbi:EIF4G [Mytilus coruscus]|uniref:Eukaryotic translation initiation factor 4 gamma 2 n=1 Tax=Mytilus coruscus TaxID=42192 RepID=A0A6J8EZ43_MYTCO|nr:EIF4G [Mytilus coruscus]
MTYYSGISVTQRSSPVLLIHYPESTLAFFTKRVWFLHNKLKIILNFKTKAQRQGGASPQVGGRDERPPHFTGSDATASKLPANSRWIPPSSLKRDVPIPDDKNDATFRKVRGILNKLTPEKFDKLSLELLNVGIETNTILHGIILLIFEKALDEPKYSSMYAQLCHQLCEDAPNFDSSSSSVTTFRRLLLNKCQDEFENRSRATEAFDRKDGPLTPEEAEQYHLAKRKMLGNIKFIGELGKLEMLHEGILHKCIKQLLEKKKSVPIRDMAEDFECLCQIMRTVGRRLDTSKAKSWMDQYFERIRSFSLHVELPSRIRFMLQDIGELRANKWVPRHVSKDNGPRTITEIRLEASDEFGEYIPTKQGRFTGHGQMNGGLPPQWGNNLTDLFGMSGPGMVMVVPLNGGLPPQWGNNLTDLFGMSGPGMVMGTIGTGTGPGVINDSPGYIPKQKQQGQGYVNYNKQNQNIMGRTGNQRQNGTTGQQSGRLSPQAQPTQQQQQQRKQAGQQSRDLPPRFAAKLTQQPTQITPPTTNTQVPPMAMMNGVGGSYPHKEEISLRPAKNFNVFKPTSPSNLPRSAQGIPPTSQMSKMVVTPPEPPKPLLNKQQPITIKQEKEKPKPVKKIVPNKEEVDKATTNILTEYLEAGGCNDALNAFKDLNCPKKFMGEVLMKMMKASVDKSDTERENIMVLITAMKSENLMLADQFMEGFQMLLDQMSAMEAEIPLIKTYLAKFAAMGVTEGIITLAELADPMENGAYYPLFLLCLQQIHKIKDKKWLVASFNNSKINLQKMLPEIDQNKERMMEILEDRGLSFMFPLLRVQSELWRQIQAEPNATALYKWIKDSVDTNLQYTTGFINVLTACVLKYVTQDCTLGKDIDTSATPDKTGIEKEKQNLDKMKGVLQMFLHDHTDLQMVTLYATQVFCHSQQFPKGMLLRLFMNYYDLEIADEEVFLKWKEEVNDEYPGKGKALFQVNTWLTWLEQAEEESDEEED